MAKLAEDQRARPIPEDSRPRPRPQLCGLERFQDHLCMRVNKKTGYVNIKKRVYSPVLKSIIVQANQYYQRLEYCSYSSFVTMSVFQAWKVYRLTFCWLFITCFCLHFNEESIYTDVYICIGLL